SLPLSTPHHALYSFPTRRSSDLRTVAGLGNSSTNDGQLPDGLYLVRIERMAYRWEKQKPFYAVRLIVLEPAIRHALDAHKVQTRSEEHTSELQSRENLVCRLLLE